MVPQSQAPDQVDTRSDRVDWSEINDMNGAVQAILDAGGVLVTEDELIGVISDGFTLVEDKAVLIGVPMLILEWATYLGDNGEFMAVKAMIWEPHRDAGNRIVFNDGSTGIKAQLEKIENRRGLKPNLKDPVLGGIKINGLRVSVYDYEDSDGKIKKAKTYYLA